MKLAERIFKENRDKYAKPKGRSLFGWRINPVTHKEQFHEGEDYSTLGGAKLPLYPLENGVVADVGFNSVRGNYVDIKYPRIDLFTTQRHLDQIFVNRGDKVNHNQPFGNTGTTGSSTGVHLHLGIKRISGGGYFDPNTFDYQEHYINGIWNEQFTRDIQTYCKEHFDNSLVVDGITSGQRFARKNIQKIGYGLKGSAWVKVLQRQLGIYPNGQLDSTAIKALQRRLGVYVDGFISPNSHTVRVMQNRLSEGKLL